MVADSTSFQVFSFHALSVQDLSGGGVQDSSSVHAPSLAVFRLSVVADSGSV